MDNSQEVTIKEILAVFFAAMRAGYTGKGTKFTVAEASMYKYYVYKAAPDFRVVDMYFSSTKNNFSSGTTTIWYKGVIVWVMNYRGYYPKEVIPFLKDTLRAAYYKDRFMGGRGPENNVRGQLRYDNHIDRNNPEGFSGREEIHDYETGKLLGYHEYDGHRVYGVNLD